jgi:hypothetical protein
VWLRHAKPERRRLPARDFEGYIAWLRQEASPGTLRPFGHLWLRHAKPERRRLPARDFEGYIARLRQAASPGTLRPFGHVWLRHAKPERAKRGAPGRRRRKSITIWECVYF